MQFTRNPANDLRLDRSGFLGNELVAASPEVLGGGRIGDPNIDPQHPWIAALGAAGYEICDISARLLGEAGWLARHALQYEPMTLARKVSDEVIGESVQTSFLISVAGQIAEWRDPYGQRRQQTMPWQRRTLGL